MTVDLREGDCREVARTLADNSIDAVVTDPPYSLVSIVKRFSKAAASDDNKTSERIRNRADGHARTAAGFMGQQWDTGEVVHDPAWWAEVYRVMKPGAHLAAFGGTRTYHRMVCAIEDAGFEIRDQVGWAYGVGFPKSHNVATGIEKTEPDQATAWQGWGTALKPAWEPIVLARKPLVGTVAENVLQHGTGGINIDACRVEGEPSPSAAMRASGKAPSNCKPGEYGDGHAIQNRSTPERWLEERPGEQLGRWPANLCHDGSDEVVALFPQSAGQLADLKETGRDRPSKTCFGDFPPPHAHKARRDGEPSAERRYTDKGATNFAALPGARRNAAGSAARFFYCAKAGKADRWGTKHPTVKPVALMRWLIRLVTPPGGVILDPFAGSGTTGIAAIEEGVDCILIEREAQYAADIRARIEHFQNQNAKKELAQLGLAL